MSVDAKAKGTRAENEIVKKLTDATGLKWCRTPLSGATNFAKGDVMIDLTTGKISKYCIEVKHYEDDQINSNILNHSFSQIEKWWEQTAREAGQMNAKPLLVFKKNRGKWIAGLDKKLEGNSNCLIIEKDVTIYLYLFDDIIELLEFV